MSGADSEAFFLAHGLGAPYAAPGRTSSKKAKIVAAIRGAEGRGDVLAVLDAAHDYLADRGVNVGVEPARGRAADVESAPDGAAGVEPAPGGVPAPASAEQQSLLQLIWDAFVADGRWPTFGEIDRRAYQTDELDVVEVAAEMPKGLMAPAQLRFVQPDQEIALTIAGAAACEGSDELVGLFLEAVRAAAQIESEAPDGELEPLMTATSFDDALLRSRLIRVDRNETMRCLGLLLGVEHWGYRSYSKGQESGPATWSFSLTRDVRPMRGATDLVRYWTMAHPTDPPAAVELPLEAVAEVGWTGAEPDTEVTIHDVNHVAIAPQVFQLPVDRPREPDLLAVMMPFDAAMTPVYEALQSAAAEAGFRCSRADDIWEHPHIMDDVVGLIWRAQVVVADLTGKNPNVFYETGIAHTLGRHVIQITQSIEDVPFDLRSLRTLTYLNNNEGRTALTQRVADKLRALSAAD